MLEVTEVRTSDELGRHAAEWDALLTRSPVSDFFQTFEWVSSWLRSFWRGRPLAFLFVRRRGELVGIAPLLRDQAGELGCHCAGAWRLPINDHSPRADLIQAGELDGVLDALLARLGHTFFSRISLGQVRFDAPLARALPDAARRHGLALQVSEGAAVPIIRLDGDWERYLTTRSSHLARELRRKQRKLEREHRVEWRTISRPEECDRALEDLRQIERGSWKERAGSSFSRAEIGELYGSLARRCAARGWLRLHLLYLDDVPAAHLLGVEHRGEYLAIKTSFDERFKESSPGSVLITHALQDACARGLRTFDLLGVESRWKRELANDTRRHLELCVYPRTALTCQLCALREQVYRKRVRPFVLAQLPHLMALKRTVQRALGLEGRAPERGDIVGP